MGTGRRNIGGGNTVKVEDNERRLLQLHTCSIGHAQQGHGVFSARSISRNFDYFVRTLDLPTSVLAGFSPDMDQLNIFRN